MEKQRSYPELMDRYREVAEEIGASVMPIGSFSSPLGDYDLYTMRLRCGGGRQRICISTGMHGDEPAGPETLLRGLRRIHEERERLDADFLIFPCDNPTGWEMNTRGNFQGLDLNREFAKVGQAAEIAIVENALQTETLDFTLDIHEDIDTYGMYLYERARREGRATGQAGLAREMIDALRAGGYDIEESDWIEGLPASGGIIWPKGPLRRNDLPKALFLWHHGVQQLITTESPGKLDLETRVRMQMVCFEVFLDWTAKGAFARTG